MERLLINLSIALLALCFSGCLTPVPQPAIYNSNNTFSNPDKTMEVGLRLGGSSALTIDNQGFNTQSTYVSEEPFGTLDLVLHPVKNIALFASYGTHIQFGGEYLRNISPNSFLVGGLSYSFGKNSSSGNSGETKSITLNSNVSTFAINLELLYEKLSSNKWWGISFRPGLLYARSGYKFSKSEETYPEEIQVSSSNFDTKTSHIGISGKAGIRVLKYFDVYSNILILNGLKGSASPMADEDNNIIDQLSLGARLTF